MTFDIIIFLAAFTGIIALSVFGLAYVSVMALLNTFKNWRNPGRVYKGRAL